MLEIRLLRASPEIVKADLLKRNLRKRSRGLTKSWQKMHVPASLKAQTDELRRRRNTIAREINEARKAGKDPAPLMAEAADLPQKIKNNDTEQDAITSLIRTRLMRLPNILHESVPQGNDDTANVRDPARRRTTHVRFRG